MSSAEEFFAYARERHSIYLRRMQGQPWPWTDDPILRQYRFTNVFRELDRTTQWCRQHVRAPHDGTAECLLATVLFRWFNRIETGEIIFGQLDLLTGMTPWEHYLRDGNTEPIKAALLRARPRGPHVTGAYIIIGLPGRPKLDGVLYYARHFALFSDWRRAARIMLSAPWSMQEFTAWMKQWPGMGKFLAYEIACDLQHTKLMSRAPDVDTWANLGPGARRGLNRIHGRQCSGARTPRKSWATAIPEEQAMEEMRQLWHMAQDGAHWPHNWPRWDMRTVEHTLCEYDKILRVRSGEGTPRQLYRHV
jgi:hypothetical protein